MAAKSPPFFPFSDEKIQNDSRIQEVVEAFKSRYGKEPSVVSRAPGRVNLIGEHVDYMGYSVLPMAIQQDILIAGAVNDNSKIRISNVDKKYREAEIDTNNVVIDKTTPHWYNYFLCGLRGIVDQFKLENPGGMDLCVSGSIPPSAGLSSSSAFVCSAALITSHLYQTNQLSKQEFAEICCQCEKYIGTIGGGMDQAISFLAESDGAKLIDFNPIAATDVILPTDCSFVIAHSLAELNKAATADFNQRVVECRLSTKVIAHKHKLDWKDLKTMKPLQKQLNKSFEEMLEVVMTDLHSEPYTKTEICELLGVSDDELTRDVLSANTLHLTTFNLQKRAKHVFSEAGRVYSFKSASDLKAADVSKQLGTLMNESHYSTRDDYNCSHENLDLLTEICRSAGALGSRLTGAGWGGCCVSIVLNSVLPEFLDKVKSEFYTSERLAGRDVNDCIFTTKPGNGAFLVKL